MGRRHFDQKGYPKLSEIINEICTYIEGLTIRYTEFDRLNNIPLEGNIIDTRKTKHGPSEIAYGGEIVDTSTDKPFKVDGIYVVGGQIEYLPNSYNTGDHDLDLKVKTNERRVFISKGQEGFILLALEQVLNDGLKLWTDWKSKEFMIDINDTEEKEDPLEPPYLQIYPVIQKVYSNRNPKPQSR